MKIKKISAIILAGALLASAVGMNAFADSTSTKPTITVFGNESSPAKPGETVELNVRLSNFNTIKGMDLILTLDGTAVAVNDVIGKIGTTDLIKGNNYTTNGGTIHIVELNAGNEVVNFKVNATVNTSAAAGKYEVTLTKSELATSGTDMIKDENSINSNLGKVVVGTTSSTAPKTGNKTAAAGYFIPFGSVYKNDEYVSKNSDGSFDIEADTTYQQFKLPDSAKNLTTFGGSKPLKADNAVQFGTYAQEISGKSFGTLIIKGDWKTFLNYYVTEKGYSADELLSKIYTGYTNAMKNAAQNITNVSFTTANGTKINVFNVPQTKYMWENEGKTIREFAARMTGISSETIYSGVGYSYTDSASPVFSTEINTYKAQ